MGIAPAVRQTRRLSPRVASRTVAIIGLVAVLAAPSNAAAGPTPTPVPSVTGTSSPARTNPGVVTFGLQPASVVHGVGHPDARPYLYYVVTPGARVTDHLAILNYSTQKLRLNVYATDALNTSDGGFALLSASKKPTDAGSWLTLPRSGGSFTVPARSINAAGQQIVGSVIVPVTLTVPIGASPGDHVGGIVASLDTLGTNSQGARVRLDQRVGTRLFIRVAGPLHPSLSVQHLAIVYHGTANPIGSGTARVSYTVRNTGNVKLGAHQKLVVSGWFGATGSGPKLADIPLLLPGNAVTIHQTLRGVLPEFQLTAKLTLTALQLPSDSDPELRPHSTSVTIWVVPWTLLVIIAALLLVALGMWAWRRRLKRRPPNSSGSGRHRGQPVDPDDDSDRTADPRTEGARI